MNIRHDAAGRRIRKVANGRTTQYVYDGDHVIAEYDGAGTLLRTFVYGPGIDEPICLYAYNFVVGDLTGDATVNLDDLLALAGKWLLTDQDSGYGPLYDLNQDGKIDNADTDLLSAYWRKTAEPIQAFYYHFDGLGSVVALSDASGNVVETYAYDVYGRCRPAGPAYGNPYRFTARRWDSETGLYYYRARYYDPAIGRFLQTDPLGYADGINWYLYCGNNPVMLVDPWGLCWNGYNPNRSIKYQAWSAVGWLAANDAQLIANTLQGLQDAAIGTVNLVTGSIWTKRDGSDILAPGRRTIPAIPSPQWAKDRYVQQSSFRYNAQKLILSGLATWGVSAAGKAASAAPSVAAGT